MRTAGRALDALITTCAYLAVAIMIALVGSVCYEVVMRYFLNAPTRWVVEFSEYALLQLAFLGGAWVLREEAHVSVEMVTELLPRSGREIMFVITSVVGAATCALFFWVSLNYLIGIQASGETLFKSVQVKKWAVMAVMAPGLLLLTLQFIRRAWNGLPENK